MKQPAPTFESIPRGIRPPLPGLSVVGLLVVGLSGGATGCGHQPPASASTTELTGRCGPRLAAVSSASNADLAIEATRTYLSCVATRERQPPADLEDRVEDALADNPYPQTQRRAREVLARFFDETKLRAIPETRAEMTDYLELLDAQILRARAERNETFAQAAEKRKQNLLVLGQVLDSVEPTR